MRESGLVQLFSLQDKVALVTGASGGIGNVLAKGLAMAGARLALNSRSAERLAEVQQAIVADHGVAEIFPADIGDLDQIPRLVEATVERFGRIDILVNCAGTNNRLLIEDVTPEVYDRIMATNLRGTYFLTREVATRMVSQKSGKIIHIGSITSTIGLSHVSVYGMTKSALAELTKTMAIEWAQHNIQVNCLCPGFIYTELTVPLWTDPQRSKWIFDRLPNKRPGHPEDLVGLAIYLASNASDYTTGQSIYVDGGFLAGSQW